MVVLGACVRGQISGGGQMSDNEVDATLLGRTNRDVMSRPTWIGINDNPTTKLFPESLSRSA